MHDIVITPCSVYMYFSLQKGETALQIASSEGHDECVQLLLDKGAKVNLYDEVSTVLQSLIVCLVYVPLCKKGIVVEVAWVHNSTLGGANCAPR